MESRYSVGQFPSVPPFPIASLEVLSDEPGEKSETVACLVDSGADASALPEDLLDALGVKGHLVREVRDWKGKLERCPGRLVRLGFLGRQVRVRDTFGDDTEWVWVAELPDGALPILGRDVLNHFVVTLNGPELVCEID